MTTRGRWRPPLKSSMSVPSNVDEERVLQDSRRNRFSRKESFQNALSVPSEDEEHPLVVEPKLLSNGAPKQRLNGHAVEDTLVEDSHRQSWRLIKTNIKHIKDKLTTEKSPFIRAILQGDIEGIEEAVGAVETNVNEPDENGFLPLQHACEEGNTDVIKTLLKLGCDVQKANPSGLTSLHVAARFGRVEATSLLLEEGAVLDVSEKLSSRTPIHDATLSPNIQVLNIIVQKLQEDPWEAQRILRIGDKDGRTALHLAAFRSLSEAINLLLAAGADVASTDNEGLTPMHVNLLSHRGKRRCGGVLSQLLEAGGDVEIQGGDEGEKLAHFAARVGCTTCLQFLFTRGADFNSKDNNLRSPLHVAASENKADAAEFLIKHNADPEACDKNGLRPMYDAVMSDSPEIIKKLIDCGVDITFQDKEGRAYVQLALLRRKLIAFESLVKNGAVKLPDEAGETLIHYCAALGFINAITFLLDEGWDINSRDAKGRTALHRSLNHGYENLATMLINREAGLHIVDDTGATPLHYAVRWGGSDAILRLLLKKKAQLGVRDRLGRTPIHYAASKFSIMSDLYILLGGGSALDSQDNMGLSPLHLASRLGNESLVRILLENGAKHDLKDVYDFLPIDHALEKNNKSIVKRLEAHEMALHPEKAIVSRLKDEGKEAGEDSVKPSSNQHRKSVCW